MPSETLLLSNVVAAVLFLIVLMLGTKLVERARTEPLPTILNPGIFLPLWLSSAAVLTVSLGFEHISLCVVLSAGIVLSLGHPTFAISFFMANLLLRTWEIVPHAELLEALPRFLAAISFVSWLLHRMLVRDGRIVWNFPLAVLLALIASLGVSASLAFNPEVSFKDFTGNFVPILALSLLVLNSLVDPLGVRTVRSTIVVTTVGVMLVAFTVTFLGIDPGPSADKTTGVETGRLYTLGLWSNANDLAALAVLALPLALLPMLRPEGGFIARTFNALAVGTFIAALWLTQSRGAILALVLGIGMLFFLRRRLTIRNILFGLVAAAVPVLLYLSIHRAQDDISGSNEMRWNYFIAGLRMVRAHPVMGVGPGNYPILFETYTPSFLEWGLRTAHSSWTLVMAEGGLVGLALFALLFATIFVRAWRMRTQFPELLISLVTYGVAISFLSHTYLISPYILFALILAASRILAHEPALRVRSMQRTPPMTFSFSKS